MKLIKKALPVIMLVALVLTLMMPALAAGSGNIVIGDSVRVGNGWGNVKVNWSASITSNNADVVVFDDGDCQISVVTNNHGTWDLVVTGSVPEGGIFFNIYAQYKAEGSNSTRIYSMPVEVYGEGRVSIVDSWGTGSDSINEVRFGQFTATPRPDPEVDPEYGSLKLVKAFDGVADLPEGWDATFVVTGPDFEETYHYSQFVNGEFAIPNDLEPGEYTVTEVDCDLVSGFTFLGASYSINADGSVNVVENEEAVVTITNSYRFDTPVIPDAPETSLTITKAIEGIDLSDVPDDWSADFEVYFGDSAEPYDTFTLTKDNLTKVYSSNEDSNMPVGLYRVVELNGGIDGYNCNTTYSLQGGMVEVAEGGTDAALTVTNSYTAIINNDPPRGPQNYIPEVQVPIVEEVLEMEEYLDEEETPLTLFEAEEEDLEIVEDYTPLGEMPQTGAEGAIVLQILALCASLTAIGTLSIVVRKAKKEND